jgi:hypothetical protein
MRISLLIRRLWLLSVLLSGAGAARAQRPAELTLPNRQSLLNGRVYLDFPAAAVNKARSADLMAADPSANVETRIMQDFGPARVVFFARELFRLAGPDLAAQAARLDAAGPPLSTRVLLRTDSLLAVLRTPTRYDSTKSAVLLGRLLVRPLDGTVLTVDAYVNPAGLSRRADYQALAEKVFATLRPGRRLLNRGAHAETYELAAGGRLVFQLPADYAVTKEGKHDFEVYHLHRLSELAAGGTGITVYFGAHPSPLHRQMGLAPESGQAVKGRFLGRPVQWLGFAKPERGLYWREQIVPDALGKAGPLAHVVITSNDPSLLAEQTAVVEAISLLR